MEISAKDYSRLIGLKSPKTPMISERNVRRKKERKLAKELGKDFSTSEVKIIAKHDNRNKITIRVPVNK
ncbi:hypothetical protein VB776_04515 [Arcicella sp. DC2W]|uniref:Uncharacterized protein n=1 Tax=Arcicella gelida TaxID=2984195 RepID=A0ABU5S199_9BACT|nr:hypothetical protein [Arcicella sp. DC2W]MEA5402161.1 hypothetical protein [Arcicella sp. DC2W]